MSSWAFTATTYCLGWSTELIGPRACKRWRAEATSGLFGRVVEIGFGSGLNVEHYPPEVEMVLAVEPAKLARRLAAKRARRRGRPGPPHRPWTARPSRWPTPVATPRLSTFILCTVADPAKVLAELRRVLRQEGRLHFLEHGIAPEPAVARWQRRSRAHGSGAWPTAAT